MCIGINRGFGFLKFVLVKVGGWGSKEGRGGGECRVFVREVGIWLYVMVVGLGNSFVGWNWILENEC